MEKSIKKPLEKWTKEEIKKDIESTKKNNKYANTLSIFYLLLAMFSYNNNHSFNKLSALCLVLSVLCLCKKIFNDLYIWTLNDELNDRNYK